MSDRDSKVAGPGEGRRIPAGHCWTAGLWPAFQDTRTGETHLATLANGERCTHHSFDGLPSSWVIEWDVDGHAVSLHPAIRAGYWRSPDFFALSNSSTLPLDA